MAKQTERHDINDTLYIFKQDNSKRWYARFVLLNHKKWLCKSTGKKDKDEAIAMAHRIFIDHEVRLETNTLVQSKRFRYVAERVIDRLEKELAFKSPKTRKDKPVETLQDYLSEKPEFKPEQDEQKPVRHDYSRALRNYHIPHFDRTYVTSIDQEAIAKFDAWREKKFGRKPASSTLLTHNSALQLVFKEAIEQKWMIAAQVPVLSSKGESGARRAAFTQKEYQVILDAIIRSESNAHTEKTRQIRELLYDYCEFAVHTGIRPGTEMENLTWSDIEFRRQREKAQFFINVRKGKTTKYTGTRKVVCKSDIDDAIQAMRERFPDRVPSDKLFRLLDGTQTNQLTKAFEKVMQNTGLKSSPMGPRTLYSLRHTYITWQLLNGTSMDVIAKQCGTSMAMIEQHYSHVQPEMFANQLSGVEMEKEIKVRKSKRKKTPAQLEKLRLTREANLAEWEKEYKERGCI